MDEIKDILFEYGKYAIAAVIGAVAGYTIGDKVNVAKCKKYIAEHSNEPAEVVNQPVEQTPVQSAPQQAQPVQQAQAEVVNQPAPQPVQQAQPAQQAQPVTFATV